MPRPGFYNDNEYRAYPFVYTPTGAATLAESVIVDAGFVLGLDAEFDFAQHSVWLASISRSGLDLAFKFASDAPGAIGTNLVFHRDVGTPGWAAEYANTAPADLTVVPCASEPIWDGFLVTSVLPDLDDGQTVNFSQNQHRVEPGCIQTLARAYLRSLNIGNYRRTAVPNCEDPQAPEREVILNAQCLQGDIRFTGGINAVVAQTDRANELTFSASKTAGTAPGLDTCAVGGEVPLFPDEPLADGSKFYGGGPACDEVISTINGVGGRYLTITGGAGVQIATANGQITVRRNTNSQNNGANGGGE
jgi:hypothetical protein